MNVNRLLISFLLTFISVPFSIAEDSFSEQYEIRTILNPVHNNKILDVMRRLKLLFYDREYTDVERQDLTRKQVELLAKETKILVNLAKNIDINDEDKLTFNAMANQIYDLSRKLENKFHHHEDLIPIYIKMQDTCNTCHKIFRGR